MYLVFDIETKNTFAEVGTNSARDLETSYVGYYRSDEKQYTGVWENEVTSKFLPLLHEAEFVIGYNIIGFDLPALSRYGDVTLHPKKIVDLYRILHIQTKISTKLDNWTTTTFNKSKIGHGLDAVRYFRNGQFEELAKYCNMDVEVTHDLYNYMLQNKSAKYTNGIGEIIEVKVEIPNHEVIPETSQSSMF